MVSAITNRGRVHWMIVGGTINADRFIEFLTGLCKDSRGKVFFIEMLFLPACSPDLNPDQNLNADLKQGIGSKVPSRTKTKLQQSATEHMTMLESKPERIRKYFMDPAINYAPVSY